MVKKYAKEKYKGCQIMLKKKKIAVVNVLFPPKAFGGATRIVTDEIFVLTEQYGDDYEVVVFTADFERSPAYKLTVYPYNGYRVYSISIHTDWWCEVDERMGKVFDEFLAFEQPDLVHFHCIQALTGSVVEVTQKRNIPHLITVHDAWWISDYQFLTDQSGKIYPEGHPDPFEKINLPDGKTLEQSIKRRSYLKGLLAGSDGVLAVSDVFRRIYEKNGVAHVRTNKNGISDEPQWRPKNTGYSEKVVCAHIGGMAAHKGYDIFKNAVHELGDSNVEILLVDSSKPEGYSAKTRWGNTTVTIIGYVNQKDIVSLYERIDVLFAPSIWPESFGLVTREATACGCWVVGSDVGAIGEDITVENGFKISATKENLLAVLNKIDRSPKKYKGFSSSGNIRYSSDQVGELTQIFDEILKKNANENSLAN